MAYSKEYLYEYSRYIDPESILAVSRRGRLIRLFCPFRVVPLDEYNKPVKDKVLIVDAVKITDTLSDVYIISGKAYPVKNFGILPDG